MNARRFTLALTFAISVIAATVAACDGGGNPRIKSFQSSSTNVPLPGGDVTFTWKVKGEDTLELRPHGVVHGTGITLSVTESTEFTLVAKGNGRSDRQTIFVGVGEPFAINGRVLKSNYTPAEGFTIFVQGKSALTDATGSFEIEGVVAPYDIAFFEASGSSIMVYRGLTRTDPTLVSSFWSASFGTGFSGTVSGVPFPTPTPPPTSGTRVHFFAADGYRSSTDPNPATGVFNTSFGWGRSPETTLKVTTIRWTNNVDGVPNAFPGYARTTGHLAEDGVPLVVNPVLEPAAALSLQASLTTEVDMQPPQAWATIDYGTPEVLQSGVALYALIDAIDLPSAVVTTASSFTRYVPDVGANYVLNVTAADPMSTGSILHSRRNLPGGATGVDMYLPAPPRILLPINSATLTSSTLFSMSAPMDDTLFVHQFYVSLEGGSGYGIYVVSSESQMRFPDLSGLGVSADTVSNGQYYGSTFSPFGSMDEFAGPSGIVPASDDSWTGYAYNGRTFYGN